MLYNGAEVQTIKLVLSGTESTGISSKQVLLNCIVYLTETYRESREFSYLEKAVWHMYAYLELGFSYADGEEIFQTVLDLLCLTREEVFPIRYFGKKVTLNKSAIRKILGKWNPKLHSMKVSEAVNDILWNIKNKNTGTYIYHSGKIISKSDNEKLWEKTFKLYIQEEAILYVNILVQEYRCSGGTETANPAAGNRCSETGIPHLVTSYLCEFTRLKLDLIHILPAWTCNYLGLSG